MKLAASALTALIVATTAGAAFANTDDATYSSVQVPTASVYASPENEGIASATVTVTSGTAHEVAASHLNTSARENRDLALNDEFTVTSFPRPDVPYLASSGR
ncbi:hypothetical protein KM176_18815 [Pseudooceanicola sp. CBS1P-1]|uniref:Uncharacterized protein n=1 Tax=Pseudooceanicola albus TaxID=2692189 RepID=A0A6L7G6T6_9RHOB|nr:MULTISPECIES: hypothetical protein [Pseudooceanicola]MBT9385930.1 hypothetical protein [Pseudooceanicola endophyticus]MXN19649.1 hypothetical protein [Pseudooceanicola albus]